MPKNWNRRFKHNRDKMKTGDIFELAEVVRNLSLRDHEKGLSTGEKQMFVKAKKILASELMYAKEMDEEEAAEWLDERPRRRGGKKQEDARSRRSRRRRVASSCPVPGPVLAAAGRGERLGADRPKAFARLGGRPLLAESLERLERLGLDRRDRVAAPPGVGGAGDPRSPRSSARRRSARRVTGGETRSESVRLGAGEVPDDAAVVLVHDAARPLLPGRRDRARAGAARRGLGRRRAGAAASPTRSSASTASRWSRRSPRGELVAAQTPQAFAADVLARGARRRRVRGDATAPRSSRRAAGG